MQAVVAWDMPIGVLVVDDSALMRKHLCKLFDDDPEFEVLSEAGNGIEAIERAEVLKPPLVVLDFQMPIMNGLDAAPRIIKTVPNVCFILFTMFGDGEMEKIAQTVGIHAVVHKDEVNKLIPTARFLFESQRPVFKQPTID